MQSKLSGSGYIMRLEKGEEIGSALINFAKEKNLHSGFFSAIGALSNLELGFYHLGKKEYTWKTFPQEFEIAALIGNIAEFEGKPFIHMHGVFSSENFDCVGGHLKSGIVGATCEIYLTEFETPFTRKMSEEIGLKLMELEE